MYDGCIKMQDEIDNYKELSKILEEKNIPIETLLAEWEGLENIEDDRDCNYVSKKKIKEIIDNHPCDIAILKFMELLGEI